MLTEREVLTYVRSLRSESKHLYAIAYLAYLKAGAVGAEPDRGGLSYMAAQAVRLRLYDVMGSPQ